MRYISTITIYEQMSFNEGVGQNILNWIKEKWRKFIDWVKSIKDKIFKPKEKIVENKIQQLENMLDANTNDTPDTNKPQDATTDTEEEDDFDTALNRFSEDRYNKYTMIEIETFISFTIANTAEKIEKVLVTPFNRTARHLNTYIRQCIYYNKWTQDQWKQKLEEVKKIIAENGNIRIGSNGGFGDDTTISKVSNDEVSNHFYDDMDNGYVYRSDSDKLHDDVLKSTSIKKETKILKIKLGDLIDYGRKDLEALKKYKDKMGIVQVGLEDYEKVLRQYSNIPEAVELIRLVYDYSTKCYTEVVRRTKDIILAEITELERVLDIAIEKVGKPITDEDKKLQESTISCNIRIV